MIPQAITKRAYENRETGIRATWQWRDEPRGWHVTVFDTDASETVGTKIFPTRAAADSFAKRCVAY